MEGIVARRQPPKSLREELKRQARRFAENLNLGAGRRRIDHQIESTTRAALVKSSKQHALDAGRIDISVDELQRRQRSQEQHRDINQMNCIIEEQGPMFALTSSPWNLIAV